MKTLLLFTAIIVTISFLSSCTIQKRVYNSGYYVQWHHKKSKPMTGVVSQNPRSREKLFFEEEQPVLKLLSKVKILPLVSVRQKSVIDTVENHFVGIEEFLVVQQIKRFIVQPELYSANWHGDLDSSFSNAAPEEKTRKKWSVKKRATVFIILGALLHAFALVVLIILILEDPDSLFDCDYICLF